MSDNKKPSRMEPPVTITNKRHRYADQMLYGKKRRVEHGGVVEE